MNRRGAAAVECAIVIAPFLLLVMGVIEFGSLLLTQHLVTNAARQGARRAAVNTDVNDEASELSVTIIENRIENSLVGRLKDPQIRLYFFDDDGLDWTREATFQRQIAVEVRGTYEPMTPVFQLMSLGNKDSIPIAARSVVRSEGL